MASFVRIVENLEKVCNSPHKYDWPRSPLKMIYDAIVMSTSADPQGKEWFRTGCGKAMDVLWFRYRLFCGGDDRYSACIANMSDAEVVAVMREVIGYYK